MPANQIWIDAGHDFGKNTYHSLEVTRRLDELVATGWPVLVSVSNKDFVGEALARPLGERLLGTLATTAICAWQGARVFRAQRSAVTALRSSAGGENDRQCAHTPLAGRKQRNFFWPFSM